MPRKSKDVIGLELENTEKKSSSKAEKIIKEDVKKPKKTSKTTTSKVASKSSSSKLADKKTTTTRTKKTTDSTAEKKVAQKKTTPKKATAKKTTTKKSTTKKETTKVAKKSTTKKAIKKVTTKKEKPVILEYYDLPYRYNQTVVKLLAQTPTTLFVYWDISDTDKVNYIKQYGEYFFNNTKPVLLIHNETMNYSFEIDINDFANCWYIKVNDSSCTYKIELGRRPINQYVEIRNDYLYITSSNELESPNDHILFDKLGNSVFFRNVKTNAVYEKDISSFSFMQRIGNLYNIDIKNIPELYKYIYNDEKFTKYDLRNPSSGNPTSTFK